MFGTTFFLVLSFQLFPTFFLTKSENPALIIFLFNETADYPVLDNSHLETGDRVRDLNDIEALVLIISINKLVSIDLQRLNIF
jgi:hypothetical protein